MDISVGRPQGFDIPKKSRSLDLRSFYVKKLKGSDRRSWLEKNIFRLEEESEESKRQENSPSRKSGSRLAESGRKRSGKEVPLSSLASSAKRRTNSLNVLSLQKIGGVSHNSGSLNGDSPHLGDDHELPLSARLDHVSLQVGYSEKKTGLGKDILIPKRPRGISKSRKIEGPVNLEVVKTNSNERSSRKAQNNQSSIDISSECQLLSDDKEEEELTNSCNAHPCVIAQDSNHIQLNDAKSRSRKNYRGAEKSPLVNDLAAAHDDIKNAGDFHDNDEENLEENAAWMLSSRFDPSCTTFSKDSNVSQRKEAKVSPLLHSNLVILKGPRLEAAGRMLRPRRHNGKSVARKRRHFYEVCSRDMDPYYLVKQRIRIFWPLDKCWYFGLVKDYDPVTKFHHVKYEDREEEWINLQNERFKLLLFPSEVSRKFNTDKEGLELKRRNKNGKVEAMKTSCIGNLLDSEPIISWLTRATRGSESPTANLIKKQSNLSRLKGIKHSKLLKSLGDISRSLSDKITNESLSNGNVQDQSGYGDITRFPELKRSINFESMKLPYVYFRRRFRTKKDVPYSKLDQDACHKNPVGLPSFLASVADGTTPIVELSVPTLLELKLITVKLDLPSLYVRKLTFRTYSFLLCYALFVLHYGKLICAWPVVRMKIVFVDNSESIRFLLFEGCLRRAVSLFCLIIRIFTHCDLRSNFSRSGVTTTSNGFEILGLYHTGRKMLFLLSSFSKLEKAQWRNLEVKLRKHCMQEEVVIADLTCSNNKCFQTSYDKKLWNSLIRDLSSVENDAASLCFRQSTSIPSLEHSDKIDHLTADSCFISEKSCDQVSEMKLGKSKFCMSQSAADHANPITNSLLEMPSTPPENSVSGGASCLKASKIHEQLLEQVDQNSFDDKALTIHPSTDLVSGMYEHIVHSPTARRSMWHRSRHTSLSRTFSHRPKMWKDEFMRNGLMSGYNDPRTQVASSVLSEGYELADKPCSHQKTQPHKKIKTEINKKLADYSGTPHSHLESLTCNANILVTVGDKGWREYGAQIVLDSDDKKNWSINVKVSGTTKYIHKAQHILQPGTTNRYNHSMMWKGGKEWMLEFTDRSQWSIFKQLHEECYNRNIRAACVRSIPIPGVRLLVGGNDRIAEMAFTPSSSKYFRQIGTEIDFALDPSHVLYDMDSDDEEWISRQRNSSSAKGREMQNITDETFERIMDMFEKLAYTRQCHEFTDEEIDEFMVTGGSFDIVKPIHEHWRLKRQKKGLPLIRQFQPPSWERHQQQLKEWELAMSKIPSQTEGCQNEACSIKKPAMFAFCLRPRGLEVLNKGSKQRSHKKLMVTGHHNAFLREQDYFHTMGRKLDGITGADGKALVTIPSYESSDSFHGHQSLSVFSPRDTASTESLSASEGSDRYPDPKLYRSHSKKKGAFHSPRDMQVMHFSSNQRSKMNGIKRWSSEHFEWPSIKQPQFAGFQKNPADIDEFRLRDAASAAQHASNMAKLKREKANWLLHKADLALHRATVALMIAEAMKASEKDSIADG